MNKIAVLAGLALACVSLPASAATTITVTGSFDGRQDDRDFTWQMTFVGHSDADVVPGRYLRIAPLTSLSATATINGRPVDFTFADDDIQYQIGNDYSAFTSGLESLMFVYNNETGTVFMSSTDAYDTSGGRLFFTGGRNLTTSVTIDAPAAAAVPEPATWGMMILGFGIAGYGLRRRRSPARTTVRFA